MARSSLVFGSAAALVNLVLAGPSLAQTPPEPQPQATATQQPAPPQPYPQQTYPQQGYPQQPYPQQPYPQQAHPQQPYPQQAFPQQAYAPQQPAPPRQQGLLVLPYVGFHAFHNETDDKGTGPGLRLGTLLGGRIGPQFSLNGELTFDVLNVNTPEFSNVSDVSAVRLDLAFSPLVHIASGNLEFVIGPKLGWWAMAYEGDSFGSKVEATGNGFTYGLNTGLFGRLGNGMGIGGLVTYQWAHLSEACLKMDGVEECFDGDDSEAETAEILSLSLALLI